MLYNKNDIQSIETALDRWVTGENDGPTPYDDGYGFEEEDCDDTI